MSSHSLKSSFFSKKKETYCEVYNTLGMISVLFIFKCYHSGLTYDNRNHSLQECFFYLMFYSYLSFIFLRCWIESGSSCMMKFLLILIILTTILFCTESDSISKLKLKISNIKH